MAKISMKLPFQSVLMLEGTIVALDAVNKAVILEYKRPRRSAMSRMTIAPFLAVFGEEGGVGQIFFSEASAPFELDGVIDSVENGIASVTLDSGVTGFLNTEALATVTSFVENVDKEAEGGKKSKGKKADKKAAKEEAKDGKKDKKDKKKDKKKKSRMG